MTEPKRIPERKSSTLWLLLLTFVVPIIAAYAYFYFGGEMSTSNNGDFIVPVIDIETLGLSTEDGTIMNRDELTHKWYMLYIAGKDCDPSCNQRLYHMRQINIALGKNADRFQRLIIHRDIMSPEFKGLITSEYPDALHAYAPGSTLANAFSLSENNLITENIYIMDPIGNIMMRFSPEISPKLILKDLNKLLKVSQIG